MKKFAAISLAAAAAALASGSALAFWDNDDNYWDPECYKKGYYDADECRDEWDPRYWMNEFEEFWDDDDDDRYRYGGFGGPMMGGPYGRPMMPYGGGYGAPMMPYGGYGAPMAPYGAPPPAAPRAAPAPAPAPAPAVPYGQRSPYPAPPYAPRPAPAPK